MKIIKDVLAEVFSKTGLKTVMLELIIAFICFLIKTAFDYIYGFRNTLVFIIRSKLDENGDFVVQDLPRNKNVLRAYYQKKYDTCKIKIIDTRKFAVMKRLFRNRKLLSASKKEIDRQHIEIKKSLYCLLNDKSAIYDETYRQKYNIDDLFKAIIQYSIRDEDAESDTFAIEFYNRDNGKGKLPCDISINIKVDLEFINRNKEKVESLYLDWSKYDRYVQNFGLYGLDSGAAIRAIKSRKRNNMDIYDIAEDDYIKYVAPPFYQFIGIISDGDWKCSKLDQEQYRIDNFEFNLRRLYELCTNAPEETYKVLVLPKADGQEQGVPAQELFVLCKEKLPKEMVPKEIECCNEHAPKKLMREETQND